MNPTETVALTMREIDRLRVIRDVLESRLLQLHAANQLGRSTRQVRRLCRHIQQYGPRGIRHGLRGKPSNNQLAPGLMGRALKLIEAHYGDFGPSFANEKLHEKHGLALSTYALRKGMILAGILAPQAA